MRKYWNLWMAMSLLLVAGLSACSDSENFAPEFKTVTLSSDNKTATVAFSEAVYGANNETGDLDESDFTVTIDGVSFTYTVDHTAGAKEAVINLQITSIVEGTEVVVIKPASATSVYDAEGKAMDAAEEITSDPMAQNLGIIGKWLSEGDNVAPLLVTYFKVDHIIAEFKADFTYEVQQFNTGNETTTPDLIFSGTYSISKSTTGEIWTIDIAQEQPYAATASGIFEVKTSPEVLWYEVVQTSGTSNTPPTPEAGFGSSNNSTLGTSNIQKYVRIVD